MLDVNVPVQARLLRRLPLPTAAPAESTPSTPQAPHAVRPRPLDDVRIANGVLHVLLPPHAVATVDLPLLQ
ncbi:hypothetical protein [Streptomyces sp. Y7]|uniref:hypothetical protein n=1 Tax=Streptomyces sp. Y7 TaxID=3342392 RepID=UPI003724A7E5